MNMLIFYKNDFFPSKSQKNDNNGNPQKDEGIMRSLGNKAEGVCNESKSKVECPEVVNQA